MPQQASATVRTPILKVTVDDQEVTDRLSANTSLGFDLRVAEATVACLSVPTWARFKSKVVVAMGPDLDNFYVRFTGILVQVDYTLYPKQYGLICRGNLYLAQQYENDVAKGTDLSGLTDQAITTYLLNRAGLGAVDQQIAGTGHTFGLQATQHCRWAEGQSALNTIDEFEQICLGYRTFDTRGGSIRRQQISASPAAGSGAITFTEGLDIESATNSSSILQAKDRVQVTGFQPAGSTTPYYFALDGNAAFYHSIEQTSNPLIEKQLAADAGPGLSCEEVAHWRIGEVDRALAKTQLATPRGEAIDPGTTINLVSPNRLRLNQTMWVQRVDCAITEANVFTQTLTSIGAAQGIGGGGASPPPVTSPTADFAMFVEHELVVIAGAETDLYVIYCRDTSTAGGAGISGYAWSTSGASGIPPTGTNSFFTTAFTTTAGKTITLVVTDTAGNTATITRAIPASTASVYVRRKLYVAGTSDIEDFNAVSWATNGAAGTIVANAPVWAAGDTVYTSTDDLATAPLTSQPFGAGVNVTALWVETDATASQVLAGAASGKLAYSVDGGATWLVCAEQPAAVPILRCIWSRSTRGQFFALTAAGCYRSDNYGAGWVSVVAAAGGETFRDLALGQRGMIAMSGGRLLCDFTGAAQSFPVLAPVVTDVVAVTPDIGADKFYCYDAAGRTFHHSASHGTSLARLQDLPTGAGLSVQARGLWRDGVIRGLLYVAGGTGGVWKTVDGFGSSAGYFQVRKPTIGSSPGGANYAQVGADGLLVQAPVTLTPYFVNSIIAGTKAISLWTGSTNNAPPSGWQATAFNDSGWGTPVITVAGPAYQSLSTAANIPSTAVQELFRQTFTLANGLVRTCALYFRGDLGINGIWINGVYIAGTTGADDGSGGQFTRSNLPVPAALLNTAPGSINVIAVWSFNQFNTIGGGHGTNWQLTLT